MLFSYAVTAGLSSSGRFYIFFLLAQYLDLHTVIAHYYSSEPAGSCQPCSQPTQWKKSGSWPTVLSNAAILHIGDREIQTGVVQILHVTLSYVGSTSALKTIYCSMH